MLLLNHFSIHTLALTRRGSQLSHQGGADAKELTRQVHLNHFLQFAFLIQKGFIARSLPSHVEATDQ